MAKKDMKRHYTHGQKDVTPVPELQGKAKTAKQRANPIIAGTKPSAQKVRHNAVLPESAAKPLTEGTEKPISNVYPVITTAGILDVAFSAKRIMRSREFWIF